MSKKTCTSVVTTIPFKATMFALNGFFFASHLIFNGKLLADMGDDGDAVSSVTSAYMSLILGSGVGLCLSTGLNFGPKVGQNLTEDAGRVGRAAIYNALLVGILSSGLLILPRAFLQVFVSEEVSKRANNFLSGYSGGVPFMFMIVVMLQLAFVKGEWYIAPSSMFLVFAIAGLASSLLAGKTPLAELGVGLGGTIGNAAACLIMLTNLFKNKFKKYHFFSGTHQQILSEIKSLLNTGWKISFQRMTEWVNIFIISLVISVVNDKELGDLNAAWQFNVLFGILSQSYGQAISMIVAKNYALAKSNDEAKATSAHLQNKAACKKGVLVSLAINVAFTLVAIFARTPISKFFLSEDAAARNINLSNSLMIANSFGILFDGVRIALAGALRGWGDLLVPPTISFGLITVLGVSSGYALSFTKLTVSEAMLTARASAIFLTTLFLGVRCYKKLQQEKQLCASEKFTPLIDKNDAVEEEQTEVLITDSLNSVSNGR